MGSITCVNLNKMKLSFAQANILICVNNTHRAVENKVKYFHLEQTHQRSMPKRQRKEELRQKMLLFLLALLSLQEISVSLQNTSWTRHHRNSKSPLTDQEKQVCCYSLLHCIIFPKRQLDLFHPVLRLIRHRAL